MPTKTIRDVWTDIEGEEIVEADDLAEVPTNTVEDWLAAREIDEHELIEVIHEMTVELAAAGFNTVDITDINKLMLVPVSIALVSWKAGFEYARQRYTPHH